MHALFSLDSSLWQEQEAHQQSNVRENINVFGLSRFSLVSNQQTWTWGAFSEIHLAEWVSGSDVV